MEARSIEPGDVAALKAIEEAADRLFADWFAAFDLPPATEGGWRIGQPGFLLVTGRPVFGFAHVLELEGEAHLEQIAVHPDHQRHGAGTALVRAALEEAHRRGYESLSLRTFLEVPWNAPFYSAFGFAIDSPESDFQRRLIRKEEAAGLMKHGPRVLMRFTFGASR